jgi:alpha-tubulin suppressor-like RCC1 family protein
VTVGWDHTCFRMTNSQVRCVGENNAAQLGDPSIAASGSSVPRPVRNASNTGVLSGVTHVSAGLDHTCARVDTGAAFCWGGDTSGQIGNGGGVGNTSLPVLVQSA